MQRGYQPRPSYIAEFRRRASGDTPRDQRGVNFENMYYDAPAGPDDEGGRSAKEGQNRLRGIATRSALSRPTIGGQT